LRKGVMLAHPLSEAKLKKWKGDTCACQPKFDGNRCRAYRDSNGDVVLFSSQANVITSMPHINRQLSELMDIHQHWDGELYKHGMLVQDIRARVGRTTNLHPDHKAINFHVFDSVDNPKLPFLQRYSRVFVALKGVRTENIRLVRTNIIKFAQMSEFLGEYIEEGYEGIILRNKESVYETKRSGGLLKYKPRHVDYYKITGAEQAISADGYPLGMLGAVHLTDAEGNTFKAGAGCLNHSERIILWGDYWHDNRALIGRWAKIKYPNLTARKIPFHPVLEQILDTNPEEKGNG